MRGVGPREVSKFSRNIGNGKSEMCPGAFDLNGILIAVNVRSSRKPGDSTGIRN